MTLCDVISNAQYSELCDPNSKSNCVSVGHVLVADALQCVERQGEVKVIKHRSKHLLRL